MKLNHVLDQHYFDAKEKFKHAFFAAAYIRKRADGAPLRVPPRHRARHPLRDGGPARGLHRQGASASSLRMPRRWA
eukprot:2458056-Pleurochrysis_carterae.AAC.1